jgi:hypothetical protein
MDRATFEDLCGRLKARLVAEVDGFTEVVGDELFPPEPEVPPVVPTPDPAPPPPPVPEPPPVIEVPPPPPPPPPPPEPPAAPGRVLPADVFGYGLPAFSDVISLEPYEVTSIEDNDSPGTLRSFFSRAGRRLIPKVSGMLKLRGDLYSIHSDLWADLMGMPFNIYQGPYKCVIEAQKGSPIRNVFLRGFRNIGPDKAIESADIWCIDGSDAPVSFVVLDRITGINSADGTFDIVGDVTDVTVSRAIVINNRVGTLIDSAEGKRRRITLAQSVYRVNERAPKIRRDSTDIDVVNLVVYGNGYSESPMGSIYVEDDAGFLPSANIEDNWLLAPGAPPPDFSARKMLVVNPGTAVYLANNRLPAGIKAPASTGPRLSTPFPVPRLSASEVLAAAGAPGRTAEEARLIAEIQAAL